MNNINMVVAVIAAIASLFTAVMVSILTSALSRRREREADWRKLKLEQYQEFILALSGAVEGRESRDAHRRYADAVNTMSLIGSAKVLDALHAFQEEISYVNKNRSYDKEEVLRDALFRIMRSDINPNGNRDHPDFRFKLIGVPPWYQENKKNND